MVAFTADFSVHATVPGAEMRRLTPPVREGETEWCFLVTAPGQPAVIAGHQRYERYRGDPVRARDGQRFGWRGVTRAA